MSKHVQTIEKTGKRWKAISVLAELGVLLAVVWVAGIAILQLPEQMHWSPAMATPAWIFGGAMLLDIYATLGKWWNHA